MIVSPGQFTQRAEFYHQLNQLTSAGLGLVAGLQQLERHPPAPSYREPTKRVLERISQGSSFSDALRSVPHWLPSFDVTLIEAGEKSGRLDSCLRMLAEYYNNRARLARKMIADLLYPVMLFHGAIFLTAFLQFMRSGNWLAVLAGGLVPIYAVGFFLIYAGQGSRGEAWRGRIESILDPIPVLGVARRSLALARLAAALEALINAGVSIFEAWDLAAAASGSPALRRTVHSWRPQFNEGRTPSESVSASERFPELFANQYHTGEISGKLDETLRWLHSYYQEEGSRKLQNFAQLMPRFIYLAVAAVVAFIVIRFYLGYFQQQKEIINGF